MDESEDNLFLKDLVAFQKRIAGPGAVNALSQVLLKIGSPGSPDFYQGTELWDFSLVDPDNRRPVDFARRSQLLDDLRRRETADAAALIRDITANWEDGRIKLYLTYKALNFRKAQAELFQKGDYLPISAPHTCSFARTAEGAWAIFAAPRLVASRSATRKRLLSPKMFGEDVLTLPPKAPTAWRNVITCEELTAGGSKDAKTIRLADLFAEFPVALLEGI